MIVCLAFFFSSCVFCFVFLRFRRVLPRLFQGPSSSDEPNVVRGRQPTRARFLFVSFLFCFLLAVEFSGIFRNERCRVTVFLSAFFGDVSDRLSVIISSHHLENILLFLVFCCRRGKAVLAGN